MDDAHDTCQSEETAAYLDGELSGVALDRFERHLKQCSTCASELRVQRQLLCTLDVAFNDSRSFELPSDFTRVVTASAENDLRTIRHRHERRRALQLCALLALVSFGLLGAATRALVFDPLRSFLRTARVLSDFAWQAFSDATETVLVLIRMIGRAVFAAQPGSRVWLAAVFLICLCWLSLLIIRYRRAEIVE
ncbi:MAG TPA: zf-HC2 domain-containing protein [Pyrinomonadaceae bacterium]|jgi:anti-sigma factor RsiW|nr:zf-HC2 domain-containing protein [Pyrinomonadaceae bacterium]